MEATIESTQNTNTGIKGLGITLWQRVILSYRTTLIGILIALVDATITYLKAAQVPPAVHAIVGVLAMAFVLVKEEHPDLFPKVPPAAAGILILLCMLPGCALFTPAVKTDIKAGLIDCGKAAIASQVAAYLPQVASALEGGSVDWQPQLDKLIAAGGSAAFCAIGVVIDALEARSSAPIDQNSQGGSGATTVTVLERVAPSVKLIRAYNYLGSSGVRLSSGP